MKSILELLAADPSLAPAFRNIVRPTVFPPTNREPCPVCNARGCHYQRIGAALVTERCANCGGCGSVVREA
jgi:hypothetical protein